MCGGWTTALKPKRYELVAIRELVLSAAADAKVDMVHAGFWNGSEWCALSSEKEDGKPLPQGTFKGVPIANIYGWKHLNEMVPNEN